MRISYERGGLNEEDFLGADPMDIWDTWFKQAVHDKVIETFWIDSNDLTPQLIILNATS